MATCEPMKDDCDNKREERRKKVMLGDLPADFLRIGPVSSCEQQLSLDEQAAIALQHQFAASAAISRRLTVTVVEAKLNKNYGLSRMDPYARLRIGNTVYETSTHYNGSKNPHWDKSFNCYHSPSEKTIHFEIFDECAFSLDERIAWASYDIPESVMSGKTEDIWLELNGKLGEKKEGSVNFILNSQSSGYVFDTRALYYNQEALSFPSGQSGSPLPDLTNPANQSCVTEEDFKMVSEMFPNLEPSLVREIMESNQGNKEHSINALLELNSA